MYLHQKLKYNYKHLKDSHEVYESLLKARGVSYIGFDTETTGLNIITDKPFLLSYGWENNGEKYVYTVDYTKDVGKVFVDFVTKYYIPLFAHNAKHDYHMFQNGGSPIYDNTTIYDSITVARLTENADERISMSLESLGTRYVDEESKFNGFYAVASNLETSIYEIININSSRWKIEQSFRILKTDFDARRAYTSTPENIRGHFAICYISLLIYRILERKLFLLDTSNNHFTTNQIISTIRNMKVYEEEDKKVYRSIYTGSSVLDALEKLFNNKLNRKHYNYFTLNKLFNKK